MPDVVRNFVSKKTFENTIEIQRQIIICYEADIKSMLSDLIKHVLKMCFVLFLLSLEKKIRNFKS